MKLPWSKKEEKTSVSPTTTENDVVVESTEAKANTESTETTETKEHVETNTEAERTPSVAASEPEDESKYPKGLPLTFLTLGLCLTTFVVALDNTIIATAIPRITSV